MSERAIRHPCVHRRRSITVIAWSLGTARLIQSQSRRPKRVCRCRCIAVLPYNAG